MMETQTLIEEIHKRHQVGLKPNDPVFVAVTLNELLLSHYLEKFQALLAEQNRLVASEGIERLNQASAMGSEMINRSLEALSQIMDNDASNNLEGVLAILAADNEQLNKKLQEMTNIVRWNTILTIGCVLFMIGIGLKIVFF